jgi:hypothetical protein
MECPRIVYTDLDTSWLLAEWHEVRRKPFSYRQVEGFVSWSAFWQLDRHGSNPMPSHAGPSVLEAILTILRGTQSIDTAVYWSLTLCHSGKVC